MIIKKDEQKSVVEIWEQESPETYHEYKSKYSDNEQWMLNALLERDLNRYAAFLCKARWLRCATREAV